MPEEQNKTFDLNAPGQVPPHASGRPVIVGHHPTMTDPMLRPVHHTPPAHQPTPQPAYLPQTPLSTPQPTVPPVHPDPTPPPTHQPPESPAPAHMTPPTPSVQPMASPADQQLPPSPVPANAPAAAAASSPPQHMAHHELPISHHQKTSLSLKKILLWVLLPLLLVLVAVYLIIDSQTVETNINLPVHIFTQKKKQTAQNSTASTNTNSTANQNKQTATPAGFSAYNDSALPFTFNYPTVWGTPTVTTEPGFSKRGGGNKSDGTFAYLVNFATNKDVQMAVTSAKYLPPARGVLYYDYLAWCLSPTDTKYYKTTIAFTSTGGVDTPAAGTCTQGPLTDAEKVDANTIVQKSTKAPDGASLGDVYTKNLGDADIPVVRVKDATGRNGDNIKIILNTNLAS